MSIVMRPLHGPQFSSVALAIGCTSSSPTMAAGTELDRANDAPSFTPASGYVESGRASKSLEANSRSSPGLRGRRFMLPYPPGILPQDVVSIDRD